MVLAAVAPVRSFANRERQPPRAGRIRPAPPGRADRNNRVDPSPYYPVFGRRMVMIGYARRPGTRRKPPAGTVPEPAPGPRAAHGRSPSSRLVRLRPMKSHATPVTRHPPGIRLFDRTSASPSMPIARTARTGSCAVTMVSVRHIGRDLIALCPFALVLWCISRPICVAARRCGRRTRPRLTCQLRNRPALLVSIAQSTGTRLRPIGCFLLVLKIRPQMPAESPALIGSW